LYNEPICHHQKEGGEDQTENRRCSLHTARPRYEDERLAGDAYFQAQEAIFNTDHELSAYRLKLEEIFYVAVLGDTPPEDFDQTIRAILAAGEPASLPPHILAYLNQRRLQARKLGPWVEGHYRPGKQVGP
jgi:hypothetical protein